MIVWDFYTIITVYITLVIGLVLGYWIVYTFNKGAGVPMAGNPANKGSYCPICGKFLLNACHRAFCRCPGCHSLVEAGMEQEHE